MKRRVFLERVAQVAAGLGFGAAAAASVAPAEASIAPSAVQQATLVAAAVTGRTYGYPDLMERAYRKVFFEEYARCLRYPDHSFVSDCIHVVEGRKK